MHRDGRTSVFGYSGHSTDGTAFNLQELLKNDGGEVAAGEGLLDRNRANCRGCGGTFYWDI